jgi:hypothetical protein
MTPTPPKIPESHNLNWHPICNLNAEGEIMKIIILMLSTLIGLSAFAQEKLDLGTICNNGIGVPALNANALKKVKLNNEELVVIDKGFCAAYNASKLEENVNSAYKNIDEESKNQFETNIAKISLINTMALDDCDCEVGSATSLGEISGTPSIDKEDKWKIRFYASHSFTTYFNSDMDFKSSRYTVKVKDYEWVERSSREFYLPSTWKKEGNNPFQWIDEPSNTFVISMEKDGHEFFLSAFHPKFLHSNDQVKEMKGIIDGVEVDGWQNVYRPFDGYNQKPGEMELARNENTHFQMTFELGYGYRFKILDSKIGNITYVPSIALGVMFGGNFTVVIKEGDWWEFDDYKDKNKIQGFGGSITNRLEFSTPNDVFGIFYENKIALYHQKHGFMDGTQEYNLGFMGNSVGVTFKILDFNKRNKAKRKKKGL